MTDKIKVNEIRVIFYPVRDSEAVGDTSVNDQGRRPSDLFFLFIFFFFFFFLYSFFFFFFFSFFYFSFSFFLLVVDYVGKRKVQKRRIRLTVKRLNSGLI